MKFKIAIVQTDIIWEDVSSNLKNLDALLEDIQLDVDLIVLCEMFATGFSMDTDKIAQNMDGEVALWMKRKAKETGAAIMGSQSIKEDGKVYNRALFALPDQQLWHYDKHHLFSPSNENQSYTVGQERKIFNYKGMRILPLICYDLRFPVWSRNRSDYDLAIYLANWPAVRSTAWNALVKARAIENQCYVCAVNRVGTGKGLNYIGQSQVVDFKGESLVDMQDSANAVAYCYLSLTELNSFKDRFAVYKDADDFDLKSI